MLKEELLAMDVFEEEGFFDYVEYSVNSWRKWFAEIMHEVEKVELKEIKLLAYFSILEMMAQAFDDYPTNRLQDSFAKFVLKFQNKYDFLEKVDPVTLFYRVEDIISTTVSLNDLVDGEIYFPNSKIISDKVLEIQNELIQQKDENFINKRLKEHRYVELLYRMRCRLSHEFSAPHISLSESSTIPSYINCSRQYVSNGKLIKDDVWHLRFPVSFIKDLCWNCFENYMEYCLREHISPNDNNGLNRFCELSWYSR